MAFGVFIVSGFVAACAAGGATADPGPGDNGGDDNSGGTGGSGGTTANGGTGGTSSAGSGGHGGSSHGAGGSHQGGGSGGAAGGDAGGGSGGSSADAGPTCSPASVSGYTPKYQSPLQQKGSCSANEIAAFWNDCFAPTATQNSCNNAPISQNCGDCLSPVPTASQWGAVAPLGDANQTYVFNSGGCLQLLTGNSGCGQASQMTNECETMACMKCSDSTYGSCATAADMGPCAQYAQSSNSQCSGVTNQQFTTCFGAPDLTGQQVFTTIANVFCGQ